MLLAALLAKLALPRAAAGAAGWALPAFAGWCQVAEAGACWAAPHPYCRQLLLPSLLLLQLMLPPRQLAGRLEAAAEVWAARSRALLSGTVPRQTGWGREVPAVAQQAARPPAASAAAAAAARDPSLTVGKAAAPACWHQAAWQPAGAWTLRRRLERSPAAAGSARLPGRCAAGGTALRCPQALLAVVQQQGRQLLLVRCGLLPGAAAAWAAAAPPPPPPPHPIHHRSRRHLPPAGSRWRHPPGCRHLHPQVAQGLLAKTSHMPPPPALPPAPPAARPFRHRIVPRVLDVERAAAHPRAPALQARHRGRQCGEGVGVTGSGWSVRQALRNRDCPFPRWRHSSARHPALKSPRLTVALLPARLLLLRFSHLHVHATCRAAVALTAAGHLLLLIVAQADWVVERACCQVAGCCAAPGRVTRALQQLWRRPGLDPRCCRLCARHCRPLPLLLLLRSSGWPICRRLRWLRCSLGLGGRLAQGQTAAPAAETGTGA